MSHAGAARNFESTVRGLAARGHDVHLALERPREPGLGQLVDRLTREDSRITSGPHPTAETDEYSRMARHMRIFLDSLRFHEPEFHDAPKLVRRADSWLPFPTLRRTLAASSRLRRGVGGALRVAERAAPVSAATLAYVREQRPDVMIVTPLVEPGSIQTEYLRAARRLSIPTCLYVSSWDNLSNKGLIHEVPDAVTVWNNRQRAEAVRLHGVPPERVIVTGAASYDHWFDWRSRRTREEFACAVGIDARRPFVLYVGSSEFIAPDEATFVVEWLEGLAEHGLGDVQVLARPHPLNPLVGRTQSQAALSRQENLTVYPAAGANPTDLSTRQDYYDSLHYSAAVVGVNTSAFLEAAILGRPVFTLLTRRHWETQAGQPHFQHLLTAGGGLLHVACDAREHADQLRRALAAPHGNPSERSARFTEEFIRPYGRDEPATPRMIAAVESLHLRGTTSRRHRFLGPPLAGLGLLVERRVGPRLPSATSGPAPLG